MVVKLPNSSEAQNVIYFANLTSRLNILSWYSKYFFCFCVAENNHKTGVPKKKLTPYQPSDIRLSPQGNYSHLPKYIQLFTIVYLRFFKWDKNCSEKHLTKIALLDNLQVDHLNSWVYKAVTERITYTVNILVIIFDLSQKVSMSV